MYPCPHCKEQLAELTCLHCKQDLRACPHCGGSIEVVVRAPTEAPRPRRRAYTPILVRETVLMVQSQSALHFGVTVDELLGRGKSSGFALPRQVAVYVAHQLTGEDASYPMLGTLFGRDHSTIMHACETIAERIKTRPDIAEAVRIITALVKPEPASCTRLATTATGAAILAAVGAE